MLSLILVVGIIIIKIKPSNEPENETDKMSAQENQKLGERIIK
jgi:hypothetical protein